MLKLQEWLTCKYAARVRREGDQDDGIDEDVLIDVLRAMVSGHAAMMLAVGLPMRQPNANTKGLDPRNSDSDSERRRRHRLRPKLALRLTLRLTLKGRFRLRPRSQGLRLRA